MALTRIAVNAAATLTHTFRVGETATDPTGTPTYAIVDANGTAVASGNATIVGGSSGQVTAALAAQTQTRLLTVTWTAVVGGSQRVEVDIVEVVSGFFFDLAVGRASDSSLSDTAKYPTSALLAARTAVEEECEAICDRSWVPRYARVVLDGTGTPELVLKHPDPVRSICDVRTLRRIAVAPTLDGTFTDFTAGQLAAVAAADDGTLRRTDFGVFTEGFGNVVVEFEYGRSTPPSDLVDGGCLTRFRSRLNLHRSGIPDRASSFTTADGGTYRLTLPSAWRTGIPDVDAIYARYSRRARDGQAVPASRPLTYDVQRSSLFHRR
jgi:hypothetical protein